MSLPGKQSLTDLHSIISQSTHILTSHTRHFLTQSLLFILPLSFSISTFPTLFPSPSSSHPLLLLLLRFRFRLPLPSPPFPLSHTLIFSILYSSFLLLFSLLALSSVSSSVYRGFYGRPVKILTSFKPVFNSFLPLLGTFIIAQIVVFLAFAFLSLCYYLGYKVVVVLFERIIGCSLDSVDYTLVCITLAVLLGLLLFYPIVNWVLVFVIVVVESKWGFESLYRSMNLIKGMRWVALMLIMLFGFFEGGLVWVSVVAGKDDYSGFVSDGWNTWGYVLRIVATSAVLTLLLLHGIAAITVLYMYCKALHGELAEEIAVEFADDYVSLPFDDNKVPHVVCFVQ